MARPQKTGLDYFPLGVDFFHDKKMKILKAKYGMDGICIYLYLLCEIYKNGYYLQMDEDFIYIAADDLGMGSNKVRQVINFLLERSLFDDKLFQSDKVLTSAEIQKQFQFSVKGRARKTPVEVGDFWILQKMETESFIKVNPFLNTSRKNGDNSSKNENNSEKNSIYKSKLYKSISKESKGNKKPLAAQEKQTLEKEYGKALVDEYIKRTMQYKCCSFYTIKKWIEEDKDKKKQQRRNSDSFPDRYTEEDINRLEQILLNKNK